MSGIVGYLLTSVFSLQAYTGVGIDYYLHYYCACSRVFSYKDSFAPLRNDLNMILVLHIWVLFSTFYDIHYMFISHYEQQAFMRNPSSKRNESSMAPFRKAHRKVHFLCNVCHSAVQHTSLHEIWNMSKNSRKYNLQLRLHKDAI